MPNKNSGKKELIDTVDGRNPAPGDMEKLPLFRGFYTSQVVQDFFHQQYDTNPKQCTGIFLQHCQWLSVTHKDVPPPLLQIHN